MEDVEDENTNGKKNSSDDHRIMPQQGTVILKIKLTWEFWGPCSGKNGGVSAS